MLRKIIEDESSQTVLKILLHNTLAGIVEYPSYEVIAVSEQLAPELSITEGKLLNLRPRDIDHDFARFSTQHAKDAEKFRINGITSNWLMAFKRSSLETLELFQVNDIPIHHNNQLVGICLVFKNITLNDILLIDKLINKKTTIGHDRLEIQSNLSEMEKEVLFFAALNKSNKQISTIVEELGIRKSNYNTIKTLISQRIYKKLDVETLDKAIIQAIENEQLNKIPESFLTKVLKDYYLLETKNECINI